MSIEFEQLLDQVRALGDSAEKRRDASAHQLDDLLDKLNRYATAWSHIDLSLEKAVSIVDQQKYRAARPLTQTEPLNAGIAPAPPPPQATFISVDGSQTMPSRHQSYPYFLINIGGIIYERGTDQAPEIFSDPQLYFHGDDEETDDKDFTAVAVTVLRDMAEIKLLARTVWENRTATAPLLAILDQRLQYWPIGVQDSVAQQDAVKRWVEAMAIMQQCGAWLAGYIERPETGAIITLLYTLDMGTQDFKPERLIERPQMSDAAIFRRVLQPGERSCVFEIVNNSTNYSKFQEKNQEICFFYYCPPGLGDIARVDVPKWAAQQPEVIAQIHALLDDQCSQLGSYPYILTRADEVAVVRGDDRDYLDRLVQSELQRRGLTVQDTGKQIGKNLTRSGKKRFSM
ncbi:MAG: DNA double-strand break repair nuclease NurA [Anaerolineae bacterium]|nr:DNA double-strand break repair nuclease NurA [Anaerolineae bacterium]MCO5199845.1 DNA double-strand break repair nuclease NurA [Anaerolineae bacterium]